MNKKLGTILLVDDDKATNFYNKKVLTDLNCCQHIQIAENGEEALDYLESVNETGRHPQPDLIFLDINMPIMDGWEFLEEYENLPSDQKASVIIVMLTTSINKSDMERAEKIEYLTGFKTKPLEENTIKDLIQEYFKGF